MCFAICEMVVIVSGGIDVSFPAVGCVAMYVPMYLYNNGMGVDNVFFFFGVAMLAGLRGKGSPQCHTGVADEEESLSPPRP